MGRQPPPPPIRRRSAAERAHQPALPPPPGMAPSPELTTKDWVQVVVVAGIGSVLEWQVQQGSRRAGEAVAVRLLEAETGGFHYSKPS